MNKQLLFREISLQAISELLDITDDSLYQESIDLLNKALSSYASILIEVDKITHHKQLLAVSPHIFDEEAICHDLETLITQQLQQQYEDYYLIPSQMYRRYPKQSYIAQHDIQGYFGTTVKCSVSSNQYYLFISLTQTPIEQPMFMQRWHQLIAQVVLHNRRYEYQTRRIDLLLTRLNHEVSHDNLTNLMNKSFLSDTLERLILASPFSGQTHFSLCTLDIKKFKLINDINGSYIGDKVLKYVAQTLTHAIKDQQMIFRIANDEFAFICLHADPIPLCEKILIQIAYGYHDSLHHIQLSARIGLATHQHTLDANQLMLNASLALQSCKAKRQSICNYDTSLSESYHRKTLLINTLRVELDKNLDESHALFVELQPIVHRNQPIWNSFEVLSRWNHPTLGIVSPGEFIIVAEQSGLIVDLGRRIVTLACIAKQTIESALGNKIRLSLNCSAQELNLSQNYIGSLLEQITDYGFQPNEFTIEITETALLEQHYSAEHVLNQLQESGFKIALDDFGTGYSSLNYIHSYPIDCIKIDASFIRNMLDNHTSEKVVSLIIQLANQLNVDLVAEGVEEEHVLAKLYAMGCHRIQGYLFSKPMQTEAIIQHLLSDTTLSDATFNNTPSV